MGLKISCIMPTRGRPELAAQAVKCFQSQTYADKELIIVDDADDPSFPHMGVPQDAIYVLLKGPVRTMIPEKRQMCCELATGDLIAHFDSDDWSDPNRLQTQMDYMRQSGKAVVGFHTMLFYDMRTSKAYKYQGWYGMAIGASLLYRRDFWLYRPWEKTKTGLASDNIMVRHAHEANQLFSTDGETLMVARGHDGDTGQKRFYLDPYKEVPVEALPASFPR